MNQRADDRPAVARLRRTRWLLTALFTAITAACLVALGTFATATDDRSRRREVDDRVSGVVTALSRDVYVDGGTLNIESLGDDELAHDTVAVAVVVKDDEGQWKPRFEHLRSALPGRAAISDIAARTIDAEEPILTTGNDADGRAVRVAAAVVANDEHVDAVILAAVDPAPSLRAHQRLELAIALACAALVAIAAVAGHLISGRSMRSALQLLDDQEQFLGDAAHELRTPLANLRLVTEAGLRSEAEAVPALRSARELADRMGRLVTGLLARTRARSGVVPIERVPLRLDQIVEMVVDENDAAATIVITTTPSIVIGDPELLALAIRNLVDNGVRHGGVGSAAPLEVRVGDGTVTLRDHGPGVHPTIGDPFERGRAGPGGSHGIGLSIVRWVADIHGGSATLEPAIGGGTIARLTLPPAGPR